MEPNRTGISTTQWVIMAIVVVALVVFGVYMLTRGDSMPAGTPSAVNTTQLPQYKNVVTVTDQFPGNIVYITTVELAKDGFVVVYDGNPAQGGKVIGSSYVKAGVRPGQVNLSTKTLDGKTYYVALYVDSNANGVFDATDAPALGASGSPVVQMFRATLAVGDKG
jgi:hypothetical protein